MDKLRFVFEQVMVTTGTRELADTSIGKTFRVCSDQHVDCSSYPIMHRLLSIWLSLSFSHDWFMIG